MHTKCAFLFYGNENFSHQFENEKRIYVMKIGIETIFLKKF